MSKVLAVLFLVVAAASAQMGFWAKLNGAQEVPALTVAGNGVAWVWVDANLWLNITVWYQGLSGAATAAHIHGPSDIGVTAGVAVTLTVDDANKMAWAYQQITAGQLTNLQSFKWYANVHTAANAGGEIRGQLQPAKDTFAANLDTTQAGTTQAGAWGNGWCTVGGAAGLTVTCTANYWGLSGVPTAAHIHGPALIGSANSAGVIQGLTLSAAATAASGQYTFTGDLTMPQVAWIRQGRTYFNIHTAANSAGEIRGQIYQNSIPSSAFAGVYNSNCLPAGPSNFLKICLNFASGMATATAGGFTDAACTAQAAGYSVSMLNYAIVGSSPIFKGFDDSWAQYGGALVYATADSARRTAFTAACPTYTTTAPNVLNVAALSTCSALFEFSTTPSVDMIAYQNNMLWITGSRTDNTTQTIFTKDAAATACTNYVAAIPTGNTGSNIVPSFLLVAVSLLVAFVARS